MISGVSAQKCASARLAQCHWTALWAYWIKISINWNTKCIIWIVFGIRTMGYLFASLDTSKFVQVCTLI